MRGDRPKKQMATARGLIAGSERHIAATQQGAAMATRAPQPGCSATPHQAQHSTIQARQYRCSKSRSNASGASPTREATPAGQHRRKQAPPRVATQNAAAQALQHRRSSTGKAAHGPRQHQHKAQATQYQQRLQKYKRKKKNTQNPQQAKKTPTNTNQEPKNKQKKTTYHTVQKSKHRLDNSMDTKRSN